MNLINENSLSENEVSSMFHVRLSSEYYGARGEPIDFMVVAPEAQVAIDKVDEMISELVRKWTSREIEVLAEYRICKVVQDDFMQDEIDLKRLERVIGLLEYDA